MKTPTPITLLNLPLAAVLATLAVLSCSAPPARAQAATNAPPQFWDTALGYFSTFNTNLATFTDTTNYHGTVWAGADYQSGLNVASSLAVEYSIYRSLSLESVTRNAAVAGAILSQQIDLGLNVVHFDTQLTLGAGGGYNFANAGSSFKPGPCFVVFTEVKKAMTDNTFAGIRLEDDFAGKTPAVPILSVFVGFKF